MLSAISRPRPPSADRSRCCATATACASTPRRAAWKPRPRDVPLAGALEKYAAQVGSAHLGAVTHSGNARWDVEPPAVG
jgi:hypothetical protein